MRKTGPVLKTVIAISVFTFVLVLGSVAGPGVKTIDTVQLHAMVVDNAYRLEGGRPQPFTIVDARTRAEYHEAHVFSAISVPAGDFEKAIDLLPRDKGALIVVYCNGIASGTSGKWAEKAAIAGYTNVVLYSEGFPAWKDNNMPIVPRWGI